jgi:hypothetical protein
MHQSPALQKSLSTSDGDARGAVRFVDPRWRTVTCVQLPLPVGRENHLLPSRVVDFARAMRWSRGSIARFGLDLFRIYFEWVGLLRKLTRSPMSVAWRIGQETPISSVRSIMRGLCFQSAVANETAVNTPASARSRGAV